MRLSHLIVGRAPPIVAGSSRIARSAYLAAEDRRYCVEGALKFDGITGELRRPAEID